MWMIRHQPILFLTPRLHRHRVLRCRPRRRPPSPSAVGEVPWEFGFQCNERYLKWDKSAQSQLVKLVVMEKLKLNEAQLKSRLMELTAVLPGMDNRLDNMKATLLADLMRDTRVTAEKVLAVKMLLPSLNVTSVVHRWPEFIASCSKQSLLSDIDRWIQSCDGDLELVNALLTKEPRILKVRLEDVLQEVKRLIPGCVRPFDLFVKDPGQFLSMEQMGLESSN